MVIFVYQQTYKQKKEERHMITEEDRKKEMIEKSATAFQQLPNDDKMFILGYMFGIQKTRQKEQPQTL
jgi:hypothetical protein